MISSIYKTARDERGTAIIEFAIVLPLLLVLLFGMIEFCLFLYNKQVLTNAAREGARTGVVMRASPRDLDAEKIEIENKVKKYCENHLITFGTDKQPVISPPAYDPARPDNVVLMGDTLTVEATFNYTFLVVPNLLKLLNPLGTTPGVLNITARSAMKME